MKHSKTTNDPRVLWEAFRKTGRVSAYLAYRKALQRKTNKEKDLP